MDLATLLGTAYREGMTIEEINTALENRDLIDRSEMTNQLAAQKRLLDKATNRANELQKQLGTAGTQAADYEQRIADLEDRAKKAERDSTIAAHKTNLLALGYDEALAAETAVAMADNDMAVIMTNQTKFFQALQQKKQDDDLKGTVPPAAGGGGTPTVDYAKLKADALAAGNDALYMSLCQQEIDAKK